MYFYCSDPDSETAMHWGVSDAHNRFLNRARFVLCNSYRVAFRLVLDTNSWDTEQPLYQMSLQAASTWCWLPVWLFSSLTVHQEVLMGKLQKSREQGLFYSTMFQIFLQA